MLLFASNTHTVGYEVFAFLILAMLAALVGELFVRLGQSNIVGIMIVAIITGNIFNISSWANGTIISFLALTGSIIILFSAGLESDLEELKTKIGSGFAIALAGVILPFGLVVIFMKYLYGAEWLVTLLVANVLVATSVAVTVAIFKQHNAHNSQIADYILVAAVIDDILGMLLLGVIEPLVLTGSETYSLFKTFTQIVLAISFILGGVFIGPKIAPAMSRKADQWFHSGDKGKLLFAFLFCFIFLLIAHQCGLAPIIGAFTAGLVLDHTHFKEFTKGNEDVEELVKPIRNATLPFFFYLAGISVDVRNLFSFSSLGLVTALLIIAIIGKYFAGMAIKIDGKRLGIQNKIIGLSMTPRGEVGMVIALMGKQLGIFDEQLYAALIMVIFLTTLLPPIVLNRMIPNYQKLATSK